MKTIEPAFGLKLYAVIAMLVREAPARALVNGVEMVALPGQNHAEVAANYKKARDGSGKVKVG